MRYLSLGLILIWVISSFYMYTAFNHQILQAQWVLKHQVDAPAMITNIIKKEEQSFILYRFKVNKKEYQGQLAVSQEMALNARKGEPLKGIIYNQKNPNEQGLKVIYQQKANTMLQFSIVGFFSFITAVLLLFVFRILGKSKMRLKKS